MRYYLTEIFHFFSSIIYFKQNASLFQQIFSDKVYVKKSTTAVQIVNIP